jgi:two-component system response regulator AtoC
MDSNAGHVTVNGERPKVETLEDQFFVHAVSPAMRAVEQMISNIASTDLPVLLLGESGTGKEAVAVRIHCLSQRRQDPFTKVVCGTLSPEFFDRREHVRGTGDGNGDPSRSGTLFLDEVAELDPACQSSLLHAFPDGEVVPSSHLLGARIVSASSLTQEEFDGAVSRGSFRKDLFYRINGVCLRLPPLRERRDDIPSLVEFLLRKNSAVLGRPQPSLSSHALHILRDYSWPGNIRELENTVKRIVAIGDDSIAIAHLGSPATVTRTATSAAERLSLKQAGRVASNRAERELILKVLTRTRWNRKRAARELQVSYKALLYKLKQFGLDQSEYSEEREETSLE